MLLQLAKVAVQWSANRSNAKGTDDLLWRDVHGDEAVRLDFTGDSQDMLLLMLSFRDSDDSICTFDGDCELEDGKEDAGGFDIMALLRFLRVFLVSLFVFLFDEETNENHVL